MANDIEECTLNYCRLRLQTVKVSKAAHFKQLVRRTYLVVELGPHIIGFKPSPTLKTTVYSNTATTKQPTALSLVADALEVSKRH